MKAYCFNQNIDIMAGDSAWNKRHGRGQFEGRTIPFGCLVDFRPQPEVAEKLPKASPDSVPGLFFGYKLLPGGLWENEYKVADLRVFKDMDFSGWGSNARIRVQTVREVIWKPTTIIFPLVGKYERANRTIEGIEGLPENTTDDEMFSELQELGAVPPVPGGAPLLAPIAPPVAVDPRAPIGRPVIGTEIQEGGTTYREDASGRRYELDASGSRTYAGSNRPPWIPSHEWRVFSLTTKKQLTKSWKDSIAADVAKAIAERAAVVPVPADSGGASDSSSAPVPNAAVAVVCTQFVSRFAVPARCRSLYDSLKHEFALNIACAALEPDGCESEPEVEGFVVPAMPVIVRPVGYKPKHRTKIPDNFLPFAALVARPVQKPEMNSTPAARAAMDIEFNKLRNKEHPKLKKPGCWDEALV